ncbi:hypothetical protein AJ80_04404 [Polytolypa hystricis UAMH7299]|uniref:Uncharacterized protein n=1 Tax=Polytolypa hystricis (strain UAMH7299) TaxID=1447883 RepID=A0A2B7YDH7_POLH7|nr:hypothetical protein AJ80_04404 [Polytolypa hystricis UAMH7299]
MNTIENKKDRLLDNTGEWIFSDPNFHMIDILAQHGASVQTTDTLGWTPLHRAADHGDTKVVSRLLQYKADVEAKDDGTWTPLYSVL